MTGRRQAFILSLILLFVAGVFLVNNLLHPDSGAAEENGNAATIRGVVETVLPSGKVIQVKKDDGSTVLLSLTGAYLITDEAGEDLFYRAVRPGMPISAAGIRDPKENVIVPSLVTVQLAYASKGNWIIRVPSFRYQYFSLRYNDQLWRAVDNTKLEYRSVPGCVLSAGSPSSPTPDWDKSSTERKIGDNIFQDRRYTLKGEPKLRVITLENPGLRYEAGDEKSLVSSLDFSVLYEPSLSGPALVECTRAVDAVLVSFLLRNGSKNILVVDPAAPVKIRAGGVISLRGRARVSENTVYVNIVNEAGRRLVSRTVRAEVPSGGRFGSFAAEIPIPDTADNRLELQVFQYSPLDGSPTDLVALPLGIE